MTNLTLEQFENGLKVYQDENLYKFTSDAIKLAKFCKIKHSDNVLDMCAGSGVVGLYADSLNNCNKLYFNEIQQCMCNLINKNIQINGLENKTNVLCKDLNDLTLQDFDKQLDIIVCNPPYFKLNSKINRNDAIAMCRHEISTNLIQIVSKASQLIKSKGKFYLVVPADRFCEVVIDLNKCDFEVKRIEMFYTTQKVSVCILEAVKGGNSGAVINIIKE